MSSGSMFASVAKENEIAEQKEIELQKFNAAVAIITAYLGREKDLKVTDIEWRAIASAYDYVAKNLK
jgi:hypothetical protein